ncbi:MAG: hypothetical protein ABIP74_02270 [Candidatus Saccharimonas sp.]
MHDEEEDVETHFNETTSPTKSSVRARRTQQTVVFPIYGKDMDHTKSDGEVSNLALKAHQTHLDNAKSDLLEALAQATRRNRLQEWKGGQLAYLQTRLPDKVILGFHKKQWNYTQIKAWSANGASNGIGSLSFNSSVDADGRLMCCSDARPGSPKDYLPVVRLVDIDDFIYRENRAPEFIATITGHFNLLFT